MDYGSTKKQDAPKIEIESTFTTTGRYSIFYIR